MNRSRGFTQLEIGVSVGVLVMVAAVVLPSLQLARLKAQQINSKDKLKNLGLAIHNYHDVFLRMPTGGWIVYGKERSGWPTSLLPFISHARVYNEINHHAP